LLVPERGLARLLLVDLLQVLERAPLQRQERVLLQCLVQAQVRGLLPQQERRLLRYEGRVRHGAQVQHREQALLRLAERGLVRGLVMGPERGHERPLYPVPWRRLLQVPEQGSHKGQALAQLSGRRLRRRSDRWINDE